MNNNLTEIVFLLDRSGSMGGLEEDTIGGFNSFVQEQAKLGDTLLTTVLFDNKYEILHNGVKAKDARLTAKDYFVGGGTALLDAIGKTMLDVGRRLAATEEEVRPGQVIFVITTDGQENASREFTYEKVQAMIKEQKEKYSWQFIFMAANIDDVQGEGAKLGIDPAAAMAYKADHAGTAAMFSATTAFVGNLRARP